MVALASSLGKLPVKCGRACDDAAVRRRWGCDKDADPAGYTVHCWYCDGGDFRCEECGGEGRLPVPRCPSRCLTPDVLDMLRAFWFKRDQILPVAGGWLGQAETFLAGCRILDSEYARLQKSEDVDG